MQQRIWHHTLARQYGTERPQVQAEQKHRDISRLPTHTRAGLGMGYAPEGSAIFPELTVAENLQISQWLGASAATPPHMRKEQGPRGRFVLSWRAARGSS